jgi:hypothetical protein
VLWYSPVRVEGSSAESDNVELRPESPVKPVLEAHPPKSHVPREGGEGRPLLQDGTVQDDTGRGSTMLDDAGLYAGLCWTMLDYMLDYMLDKALLRRA